MLFSHISDTHLGLAQYGLEERTRDIYNVFNQAIDISISDHVDFVIFAGDIFNVPNPDGEAIVQMANGLKRLKENDIDSFFILGDHDISRVKTVPVPFVYHNLDFSKYIGNGTPLEYRGIHLVGFDKIRKAEMPKYEEKFAAVDTYAKAHTGHKILVLHQGITEFNKYAGELLSTDLPKNFTYYAMGHLHDKDIRHFNHLAGPVAYPGSTERTTNERIVDTEKGFLQVDISRPEASTKWIKLDSRPHISYETDYQELAETVNKIAQEITRCVRKPIIEVKIKGDEIDSDRIQSQMAKLDSQTLRCFSRIISEQTPDSRVLLEKPNAINETMYKLTVEILGSEQLAKFAIDELLPILSKRDTKEALGLVFEKYKEGKL